MANFPKFGKLDPQNPISPGTGLMLLETRGILMVLGFWKDVQDNLLNLGSALVQYDLNTKGSLRKLGI